MKIIPILGAGIVFSVIALVLKDKKKEYALLVSIGGSLFVFFAVLSLIKPIINDLGSFLADSDKENIKVVIKALGIGYLTEFSSDTCRDAGETSLASKIELFGKVAVVSVSLPIITGLFNQIKGLLQ